MSKEEKEEWVTVQLPSHGRSRAGMPIGSVALHYLKATNDWTLYVFEPEKCCPVPRAVVGPRGDFFYREESEPEEPEEPFVTWTVGYKGHEIVGGELRGIRSAKAMAMRVFTAICDEDPELPQKMHGVIGH
jgi:hypothetical protein